MDDGEWNVVVHVHRSERTDTLLAGLAQELRQAPADPFTPEIVAVPTRGIERFIAQGLGQVLGAGSGLADGVCANVRFPSPHEVVHQVIAQASGMVPEVDPWLAHRAVWPLLAVIDRSMDEPWCAPLARHLAGDHAHRRFPVARHLTNLFSAYASQRPDMLLAWSQGSDEAPGDLAWQPALFRELRAEIGQPSPAERLHVACRHITDVPASVDLPERLSVFGPSRLPTDHLRILAALGAHRDVHLWLPDASPAAWSAAQPVVTRRADAATDSAAHPLVRTLGRDARELRMRLREVLPEAHDEYLPSDAGGPTLLGQLQSQIRDDVDTGRDDSLRQPPDRSIQIHACHGQPRQAEVLREVVLGLLQDDPTLQPRDILIMCPDLDAFAPLLSAAFSDSESHGNLRLRIADRTPQQSNDVLSTLAALLEMITGRLPLSTLLDFAGRTPVRTRFGFDTDDMERLEVLTAQAGIRWGDDVGHRLEYHLATPSGTWSWGLDRLLLGAALSEDGLPLLEGVLPVDDVNSGDVDLVGRLAELVTIVHSLREVTREQHRVADWAALLTDAVESLMQTSATDAWQMQNALASISGILDGVGEHERSLYLSLTEVQWLLADLLAGRPTRTNFRSGDLTVCGMAPMRSVPHRVICLVGMDDGAFPRSATASGDDILARDPHIGERDTRSEDRQVLLDAIMAATQTLVITYTGADNRTNQPCPPCVPLGELIDTLSAMTTAGDPLVVHHPLQPFDPRNFTAGALGCPHPFSHNRLNLAAAIEASRTRSHVRAPRVADLPDLPEVEVTELPLDDLATFLSSPAKAFLRARIGTSVSSENSPAPEALPLTVAGLDRWAIGDRALRLLMRQEDPQRVAEAERARGALPPGDLGAADLSAIGRQAQDIARRFDALRDAEPDQVNVRFDVAGIRLVGTVPDVYGERIVRATFSRSKAKDEVRLWPQLLALAVARPDRTWHAHLVTLDGSVSLKAPSPLHARQILAELVALYRSGMRSPLPLPPASSRSYAKRRMKGLSVTNTLRLVENGSWGKHRDYGDRHEAEIAAVWGPDPRIEDLLADPPRKDENWFDETTRFGMLSRRLWEPIIAARAAS